MSAVVVEGALGKVAEHGCDRCRHIHDKAIRWLAYELLMREIVSRAGCVDVSALAPEWSLEKRAHRFVKLYVNRIADAGIPGLRKIMDDNPSLIVVEDERVPPGEWLGEREAA